MKKIWIFLAAVVLATGIAIVGCSEKNASPAPAPDGGGQADPVDFESFEAKILDYNLWKEVTNPCAIGLTDYNVALCIGKGAYSDPQSYPGEVRWTVTPEDVLKFVKPATSTATVSEDGYMATGFPILIRPIAVGNAMIRVQDAAGNKMRLTFFVETDEHYDPETGGSSSGEQIQSSSSVEPYSSSSKAPQSSSSKAPQSSSSKAPQSSSSKAPQSSGY